VIGSSGKLVGYGGGLPLKKRLLALEGALALSLRL
jgi:methylated-DNA-[protein]-cysteine S-methyltransferase